MRPLGAILATLGTALIVLAALRAGAAILGDSLPLAAILVVAGALLLVPGAWLMLRRGGR